MKIVAIDASQNSAALNCTLNAVAEAAEAAGAQVGFLSLADYHIRDCVNCKLCALGDGCKVDDGLATVLQALEWADGVIIGVPLSSYGARAQRGEGRAVRALLTRLRTHFESQVQSQPRLPGLESVESYLSKAARDAKQAIIVTGSSSEGGIGAFFNLGDARGQVRSLRHALAACNIDAVGSLSVERSRRDGADLSIEQRGRAVSMGRLIAGKV